MTTRTDAEQQGFVHSALLYQSQGEYLDFVLRFVVDGLAAGEPVLIAVPGENLALLRATVEGARCVSLRLGTDLLAPGTELPEDLAAVLAQR